MKSKDDVYTSTKKQEKKMKYLKRNKNKIEIVKECEKSKKFNDE